MLSFEGNAMTRYSYFRGSRSAFVSFLLYFVGIDKSYALYVYKQVEQKEINIENETKTIYSKFSSYLFNVCLFCTNLNLFILYDLKFCFILYIILYEMNNKLRMGFIFR